jgi:hypothetical protein
VRDAVSAGSRKATSTVKRKTEITIQTHRVLVIRQRRITTHLWCERCGGQVEMLAAEQAAAAFGLSQRVLFRKIEGGQLHFTETDEGPLLICSNSILHARHRDQT